MTNSLGRLLEVVGVESAAGKARLREMEKLFRERPTTSGARDLDAARAARMVAANEAQRRAPLKKASGDDD